jgi:hypothetical protein
MTDDDAPTPEPTSEQTQPPSDQGQPDPRDEIIFLPGSTDGVDASIPGGDQPRRPPRR